jgi:predicted transcriptional regulator
MRGAKKERILRVLLKQPDGSLSIYRIAKEANCTHVWVIKFLRTLEQKTLVEKTKVNDIQGLFNYWKEINKYPLYREYNIQNPIELLKKTKHKFALTTYYAETYIQNYLFPSRVDIYIKKQDFDKWHIMLTKHGLVGKGNMRLLIEDEHVFYANIKKEGLRIVSMPQLILDLLREEGVTIEAAHMLMGKEYHGLIC